MNTAVAAFLGKHNFPVDMAINPVIDALLYDMNEGLSGRQIGDGVLAELVKKLLLLRIGVPIAL